MQHEYNEADLIEQDKARKAGEAIDALLQEKNICPVVDDRENIKNLIYAETQPLREQLETARKALDRIRLHNDSYVSHRIATEALDLIGAGQTDKCPRCGVVALNAESLAAGCLNCGYTAGQKGGK